MKRNAELVMLAGVFGLILFVAAHSYLTGASDALRAVLEGDHD